MEALDAHAIQAGYHWHYQGLRWPHPEHHCQCCCQWLVTHSAWKPKSSPSQRPAPASNEGHLVILTDYCSHEFLRLQVTFSGCIATYTASTSNSVRIRTHTTGSLSSCGNFQVPRACSTLNHLLGATSNRCHWQGDLHSKQIQSP